MRILASELKPTIAAPMCSSTRKIFQEYSASSRFSMFSSEPRTTPSLHRMPMIVAPRFTSSMAYSTWKSLPSGENTVIARSYAPGAANTDITLPHISLYAFVEFHINTILKTFPKDCGVCCARGVYSPLIYSRLHWSCQASDIVLGVFSFFGFVHFL